MRLIDADAIQYFAEMFGHDSIVFKSYIDDLPSVDAEPVRHGHWMPSKDNTILAPSYECSVCGRKINTWGIASETAPYCHCGVKMDEVQGRL